MDFNIRDKLFRYSVFNTYWRKKLEYNGAVCQLSIDSEKA
jgi:hypothetical protein